MPLRGSDGGGRSPLVHPLVLVPLALAAWVYLPITGAWFYSDDLMHLASIESDGILRFLLAPFGGHNYLVRNLVFLASWEAFGLRPDLFYWTVLLTHLVNVWLLFGVVAALTSSPTLACFGAALWGASPLVYGSVGWYSAFGHVLVATFLLIVLYRLVRLRSAGQPPSTRAVWSGFALLIAGTTCFGVGLGVALAFPMVGMLLVPGASRHRQLRAACALLPLATLGGYFALRRLYVLLGPLPWEERMHESLALHSLPHVPALLGHLLAFSTATTTLGFFLQKDYPSPAAWAVVVFLMAGVGLVLWRGDRATQRAVLAMIALAAGVYFVIAVGRSGLYAMFHVPPANAAIVDRYHYVGAIPIAVLLCLVLRELAPALRPTQAALALGVALAGLVAGNVTVGVPIADYRFVQEYVRNAAQEIEREVRTHPPGSMVHLENEATPQAVLGSTLPSWVLPGRAGVFVLFHPTDQLEARLVRFVERDDEVAAFYGERPYTRFHRLLVRPGDAPR
jgi:hypothetical protein